MQCRYKCKLDETKSYCIGCNRTLKEIREYGNMARFSTSSDKPALNRSKMDKRRNEEIQ